MLRERKKFGLPLVLGGTLVSSLSGFGVLTLLAPQLGAENFAIFSIFWSTLFFFTAITMGIQQEATRITSCMTRGDSEKSRRGASLLLLSLGAAVIFSVVAATYTSALAVGDGILLTDWLPALLIGICSYSFLASLSGMAAGRSRWGSYSLILYIDGGLRLVLVVLWGLQGWPLRSLPWIVVLPFVVALLVFSLVEIHLVKTSHFTGLSWTTLATNVLKIFVGTAASAALINGFPALIGLFVTSENQKQVGAFVLIVLITRAPVLLLVGAAQSYLISFFSRKPTAVARQTVKPVMLVAILTGALSLSAFFFGKPAFEFFFGADYALDPLLITTLTASSGFIGVLTVTGAAAISEGKQGAYAFGWLAAFVAAVLLVFSYQEDITLGASLGLIVGPSVGVFIHLVSLRRSMSRSSQKITHA